MCVCPANVGNGREREEMRKFWNDVNECLMSFESESRIVLIGDINGRVGSNEIAGVVRKWGINENEEHLVDCAERVLFIPNTFFQHRLIHIYSWRRNERGEQKREYD